MFTDVGGIILAGGKSSRMGVNKALLKIGNITVIEFIVEKLKTIFEEIILITNTPEDYEFLKIKIFEDFYKNIGPLAGVHSGLINSTRSENFILSCDMVLMKKELIEYIVNFKTSKSIKLPEVNGILQPLSAVYTKKCIAEIEETIKNNIKNKQPELNSLMRFVQNQNAEIIKIEHHPDFSLDSFLSMNDMQDYNKVLKILTTH